jgi:Uma2 family endonuclease
MRAVMLEVPRYLLEERRRLGLDSRDEMWDGELHMVPPPHAHHGSLNDKLGTFFNLHWEFLGLGRTYIEAGVRRPGVEIVDGVPRDYRVPDRSFLLPARFDRLQDGWIMGGPDAVLEIESPGGEDRDKLPFYLSLGVERANYIHRDTRAVEVLRARPAGWEVVAPGPDGWVLVDTLRVELRAERGDARPALHVRRSDERERALRID